MDAEQAAYPTPDDTPTNRTCKDKGKSDDRAQMGRDEDRTQYGRWSRSGRSWVCDFLTFFGFVIYHSFSFGVLPRNPYTYLYLRIYENTKRKDRHLTNP